MLGDELKKDIADPTSPFQNFLKYSPDALNYFFDQCIVKPCDIQVQGESFFDFFLFETDPWQESEMDIFNTIVGKSFKKSASADGGPRSLVCARETLRSAPHRH